MYKALPNCLHVKDSPVAGQGLFATQDIPDDVYLGISHVVVDEEIMRTPLGGFINHADQANCYLECTQDWDDYLVYNIITKRPIKKDEELTLNYEV